MWLPFQILKGNVNSFDVVKQEFKFAPTAQYVRFWPENFTSRPCLRIEMFGNPVDTATKIFSTQKMDFLASNVDHLVT